MRTRLAVALAVVPALAAVAVVGVPAVAAGGPVAVWGMNERAGTTVMTDTSGNGLHGTVGREVVTHVSAGGAVGYRFPRLEPDTPPTHPQHLVIVPDRSALDPGSRDYTVTVRLRTTHSFGNIIQKGQATVSGGNFKLQIPSGLVQCLFRGSGGSVMVTADRRINDGAWHTVACTRTSGAITLVIDGRVSARKSGRTGTIANTWPLTIGGKHKCDQIEVGCDYFAGDIDYARIDA